MSDTSERDGNAAVLADWVPTFDVIDEMSEPTTASDAGGVIDEMSDALTLEPVCEPDDAQSYGVAECSFADQEDYPNDDDDGAGGNVTVQATNRTCCPDPGLDYRYRGRRTPNSITRDIPK